MKVTQSKLKELFDYDHLTGKFRKTAVPGTRIGCTVGTIKKEGYIQIQIDGEFNYVYRLAWLYFYGEELSGIIDHIDHDKKNNRIINLRDVSRIENGQNQIKVTKQNLSYNSLGVSLDKRRSKFYARINFSGKKKFLGYFSSKKDAYERYVEAKRTHHAGCIL